MAKLGESETRLQAAVDLLGMGLYSWNPQTNALQSDARVKAIWGFPSDADVSYDAFISAIHPDDKQRVEDAITKCIDPAGDGIYETKYRVIGTLDGIQRWVATRGQTTFESGRPVAFLGVALDITERKEGERRLRQSEAFLAAILDQLPVGAGVFDRDGYLTRGNSVLRRFLVGDRLPSREPAASVRWQSFHADGSILEASEYPGARALMGEVVAPGIDFLHKTEDGCESWIRVSAAPFRQEAGPITGAVVVAEDIDKTKRVEIAHLALISELHHRTRNLLGLVRSLSDETLASCSSLEQYAAAFGGRLAALSRVQSLLTRGDDRSVTMKELLHLELQALGNEPNRQYVSINGPEIALPTESVQILALAIHELATNARKHGALRVDDGRLAVSWTVTTVAGARQLTFIWQERGPTADGDSTAPRHRGLGLTLLQETLPFQLDAQTTLEFSSNGLCCSITMEIA